MKRIKISIIAAALVLSLLMVSFGTFSFFSDSTESENRIVVGTLGVELHEDAAFAEQPETGAEQNHKTFYAQATGTKKQIVRAFINSVFIEVKAPDTTDWQIPGDLPSNAISYTVDPETLSTWNQDADFKYWYYGKVLDGINDRELIAGSNGQYSDETSLFKITDVTITADYKETLKGYKDAGYDIRVNMNVGIESCQATNGAYLQSWGEAATPYIPSEARYPIN